MIVLFIKSVFIITIINSISQGIIDPIDG